MSFVRQGAFSLTPKLKAAAIAVACVAGVVFLGWAYNRASIRTAEMNCTNNVRSIALALDNYYSTYKRYPSPDFGGHSWRIRCVPFVLASPMYSEYSFDEAWDSDANFSIDIRPLPSNKIVTETGEMTMEPDGIPYPYPCEYSLDYHYASYLMLVGDDAFGKPHGWRTRSEIVDGLDSTIAVAETSRTDVHWLSPIDLDVETMSFTVNDGPNSISSRHPRGPAVMFCDGAVFRLNPLIDPDTLKALVTIDGGEEVSRDQLVDRGMLVSP